MDVEVRHLRAFLAVARAGSLTRASGHLLITQPALTRTIQQLEAILQVTLLERTSLVINTMSGTTGPWSWPTGQGPARIVETRNFDEWLESVAADRGIGVVPDVAMRRNIHSAVRFIPLVNAPSSPVWLAFLPRVREALLRQFAAAGIAAAASGSERR